MCRSAIVCSILFTLITATCSKSIGSLSNEDIDNTTDSRVTSDVPTVQDQSEFDSKLSAKRSLLVLMPASEEKGEFDCIETPGHSQKTKRCKTPIRLGASPSITRREEILKTIQDRLKPRDEIVGASRTVPLTKTDVFDDGKYICYCQQKDDPSDRTRASKPQQSTKRIKPLNDDRNMLVGSKQQKPVPSRVPHRPNLPNKSHPSVPQHSSRLQPKIKQPILREKGQERMPYIPYAHRVDPDENPTKFNIPFNSGAVKPDSIVGQQAPVGQQSDLNEDQQMVGQSSCPSNILDQTLTQSPENVPTNDQQEASNVYDNNLQSEPSNPSEDGTESSIEKEPSIPQDSSEPEDSNVQAIGPESTRKENEYETTGSGVLDYSEIKEVTNAYFTSKAYTNETEHGPTGYDDFHVTGEDRDYNVNVQSRLNDPEEDRTVGRTTNIGNANVDGVNEEEGEEEDAVLGENNPNFNEDGPETDDSSHDINRETVDETDGASPAGKTSELILEGLSPPDETDESEQNEEKYLTNKETIESPEQGIGDEESEEEVPIVPSMGNDYTTKGKDLINENFATVQATNSNEDASLVGSTLNNANENTENAKNQPLPFCDNSLLQSTIKSVVNDFAKDSTEETVGAAKDEEFLPEVVEIPNLKNVLTMPPIEQTIMDRVKDRLSKIITIDRKTFDNDKTTNMIRNTLRHMLSAAPIPKTELPPMTVEEHQFKNGKWVTNVVTLTPETDEEVPAPTNLKKVQTSVRDLIRDPALGLKALKHPVVQNMIVESVRNTFEPGNEEAVDDSVVRNTLNEELILMQTENKEDEDTITEAATESDGLDASTIDMKKLLDIAKGEAGIDKSSTLTSVTMSTVEGNVGNSEDQKDDTGEESVNDGVVGAAKNEEGSMTSNGEELPEEPNYKSSCSGTRPDVVDVAPRNEESSTEGAKNEEDEKTPLLGMGNTDSNLEQSSFEAASERDLAYLGKISVQNKNNEDDVQNLRNSELYYVGDGVKLPLEIRKLNDGSYALSISKRVCEHLLNKECPCCVPVEGNVVRTVRRSSDTKLGDDGIWFNKRKRITDDESTRSILFNDRRKRDSADNSLHIFSMPVESFARRYNLSLDLQRARTPWNSDEMKKIDEHARDRPKNLRNKGRNNVDVDLLRDLLAIHSVGDNDKTSGERVNDNRKEDATSNRVQKEKQNNFDRYRYQRNVNKNVNKRVEIVTNILNWLRDMILNTSSK